MEKLRILGFDDDNHSPCFRCEDGTTFCNCQELVAFLSKPHDCEVEVKMFAIVDEWSAELEKYEEEEINAMFDALAGTCRYSEDMVPEDVFNLFWESANRNWW